MHFKIKISQKTLNRISLSFKTEVFTLICTKVDTLGRIVLQLKNEGPFERLLRGYFGKEFGSQVDVLTATQVESADRATVFVFEPLPDAHRVEEMAAGGSLHARSRIQMIEANRAHDLLRFFFIRDHIVKEAVFDFEP